MDRLNDIRKRIQNGQSVFNRNISFGENRGNMFARLVERRRRCKELNTFAVSNKKKLDFPAQNRSDEYVRV